MDVGGKKISILGAERSGIAVALLLKKKNAIPFVSDSGLAEKLKENITELQRAGITFETDAHTEKVFDCSLIVISPGVPHYAPVVLEAQQRGIKIVSEIEVASWFCSAPIIAITGSNGKTTTTTLIGRILSDAKKKHVVAGNIGTAFSSIVLDVTETDIVVLEVSSFQLEHIDTFRPKIAILLNITQNHLDRYHQSMELYAEAKSRIFMNQRGNDLLIYNADDALSVEKIESAQSQCIPFSTKVMVEHGAFCENAVLKTKIHNDDDSILSIHEISIKGEHNLQNAMAATLAAQLMHVDVASIRATLKKFKGVEHRQEFVREVNGIKYINNSKATTVEAVESALKSYDEPIVLIMGGKDKGNNYEPIFDLVQKKVRAIVATGYSAETIVKKFSDKVRVVKVETIGNEFPNLTSMKKTIDVATSLAHKGDIVLLSPACTSFDWFKDYEERGRVFKQLVMGISKNLQGLS